tara:strand:- start:2083 stop:2634 length:552 start_codon:yes stop_codon:yes gene_type:complete
MATLRPFRDYDEKDVINLFSLQTGATLPVLKGTMVKLHTTGWQSDQELELLGHVASTNAITNVTSQRYGIKANVDLCGAGDTPLGMLLHDVRSTDENGELLKFNPRKAAEMEAVIEGQAVPIVTRGIFLMKDIAGTPTVGAKLYAAASGEISTTSASNVEIGIALGAETNDETLILLDINRHD